MGLVKVHGASFTLYKQPYLLAKGQVGSLTSFKVDTAVRCLSDLLSKLKDGSIKYSEVKTENPTTRHYRPANMSSY